jgi:hypothetical protein
MFVGENFVNLTAKFEKYNEKYFANTLFLKKFICKCLGICTVCAFAHRVEEVLYGSVTGNDE